MIWSIYLATDLDQRQQATAIISQLRGEAALMAQNMSDSDILQDPVNYLLHNIAQAFAPTEDGRLWGDRTQAIRELKSLHQERYESIDAILGRYNITRWRATMGNADRHVSRKECTGILLQALGVTPQDIRQVLLPVHGRFLTT